ncbi:MAG: phosphoribosyl-ATP diphosphatase [Rubrivivax sp.]|jgi:phosphoribosyl-ATP pyrophosphohydrolase|nr:phosphoribosyl-ATP diphosphatase [Rubrivivax sp.]
MNAVSLSGDDTLARLAAVIESRRPDAGGDPDKSYVARLFAKGPDAALKKVGEEATELVMAAKDGQPDRVVAECADLWFHTLVVLAQHGLGPEQVLAELRRREGLSGLEEFALRKQQAREAGERESAS